MDKAALDCLVIGAGPAGLTAAIYLARFRRHFRVVDSGASRAALIPVSHNLAGFPEGIAGTDVLQRMSEQARKYGAQIVPGTVTALARDADGMFAATLGNRIVRAKTILMATGVVDAHPDFPALQEAIHRGLVRYCAICDGYEVKGLRVGVIGRGNSGLHEALFLRTYTSDITLMSLGTSLDLSIGELAQTKAAGIKLVADPVISLETRGDAIACVAVQGDACATFDSIYAALGSTSRSDLARGMGACLDEKGCLITDPHQQSSIQGLYAAGDIVSSLDQISVAMGEAATAATAIHNVLRQSDVYQTK